MTRIGMLFAVLASVIFAAPAHASGPAPTRVFVAAQGSDSNPCTFALPCRTFLQAHNTVAAGGEIDVLDPAGYGALTITKAISIQGHGFSGVSTGAGADGITVSASAGDAINLSGLIIEGAGVGHNGILFNGGGALTIDKCVIRNLTNNGIQVTPLIPGAGNHVTVTISDTLVARSGDNGIVIQPSASVAVTLTRVASIDNGNRGLAVVNTNSSAVTISDSVFAGNGMGSSSPPVTAGGVVALLATAEPLTVMLFRSTVANNLVGLFANFNVPALYVGQSTVSGNASGWQIADGSIVSFGDNYIIGNGGNSGALGSATKQ